MDDDDELAHGIALKETGFWGRRGAGCLIYARSTGRFLIGLRSYSVEQPATWGTWGGAVSSGMSPAESVLQEVLEETAYSGEAQMVLVHTYQSDTSDFTYDNFIAIVDDEFDPILNWEHDGFTWAEHGEWPEPLHFGLVELFAKIPDLRAYLDETLKPRKSI